jgi:hypothetical protein
MKKCWKCFYGSLALSGILGGVHAGEPKLPAVQLAGNYFAREGHRFLATGVHWVPAKAAVQWPLLWQPKDIEADFAQMQQMGVNVVRFDLLWAWFEPRPGVYNPKAFEQLDVLVTLAHRHRIYLHPTLFVGGEVGEAFWDVPWRNGRNPQSDPEMLRLETDHARELAHRYAGETAIIAWDLTDEPPFWIAADTTDAMAVNWTRLIAGGIRRFDHAHPIVVGVSTQDWVHGPFRPDTIGAEVDFFSVHPYTIYTPELFPDAMVSERGTYGAAFETTLSRGAGKPVMVQEMGASTAQYSPRKVAEFDEVNLYSSLGAGANGFLLWCYTDAAPEQYNQVPYLRSPHETQFGLTTWDRKLKDAGETFVKFAKVAGRMHLDDVEVARGDAAILIPEEWARVRGDASKFGLTTPNVLPYVSVTEGGAVNGQTPAAFEGNEDLMSSVLAGFVLAHAAGFKTDLPREYADWSEYPLLLLPAPLTATEPMFVHVHTDFWAKAADYVRTGGRLYASLSANSAIPGMAGLFGVRMSDSSVSSEVTYKFVQNFGDLKPGDTLHFSLPGSGGKYWGTGLELQGAQVLAVDEHEQPVLVSYEVGKGRTLLSAFPLESFVGHQPMGLEGDVAIKRLFRALRQWANLTPAVSSDKSPVEAAALIGRRRGYFVLVNHSASSEQATVLPGFPVQEMRRIDTDPDTPMRRDADGWHLQLPGYTGAVLEWRGRTP